MKNYVCNPINMEYKYQIFDTNGETACREAADPSLILFKGKYYLFPSMTTGFWQVITWLTAISSLKEYASLYISDVRVIGDYLFTHQEK